MLPHFEVGGVQKEDFSCIVSIGVSSASLLDSIAVGVKELAYNSYPVPAPESGDERPGCLFINVVDEEMVRKKNRQRGAVSDEVVSDSISGRNNKEGHKKRLFPRIKVGKNNNNNNATRD